ncbi:hypothetical protein [Pseudotabrizicola sp. 4114]|uniref:hypothetical protein n=1 Tax=Pseudotabrizicola sp. 4114 TaxID=2817731 RepID=UPI00285DA866|nr:hypothetical protein [Pseudorhodobacter sp. 4114]
MSYQTARNTRREARTLTGRFRGGKLAPVMATAIRGNEAGMLSQSITLELDPIAGRMITPITGEIYCVFVPVQAVDALRFPDTDYAGMTEVVREKLLSGNPLFELSAGETEISKRCGVNPRSVGGAKRVCSIVHAGHNAAVNFLRLRKYHKATLLPYNNYGMTPAIISQTVLERFNAVLDPDDRINGSVELELSGQAPVRGIRRDGVATFSNPGTLQGFANSAVIGDATNKLSFDIVSGQTNITADLDNIFGGGISLTDFYNAETKDKLTRYMQKMAEDNPQYGEEMVLRYAHGLSVDTGKTPILIHHETRQFGRSIVPATDTGGVQNDIMRSDMMLVLNFNAMVPKTELGGVVYTFAVLKPDENISSQPHPFLAEAWGADNFVADELALDPVPVTIRDLNSDCTSAQESTVTMFTGLNALKSTYVHYGLSRQLNPTTIANKTALWQLNIPLSVTPNTILYPDTLDHYPFADQLAEVCTYTISSNLTLRTPLIFGPTPVETLAILDGADIFGEDE